MDTDDLTEMAYQTIRIARDFSDILAVQIGASASRFATEDEFLRGTAYFLDEILEDPEGYLDTWDLIEDGEVLEFKAGVRKVRSHVLETLKKPREERGRGPFQ